MTFGINLRKRILDFGALQAALAWAAASYIRLVHCTTRWSVESPASSRDFIAGRRPFIGCF